ncbi:hypothetical protein Vadar_010321 [Vaccinium darrowii]|uniref:Uncharacterized protein n=1 Tax=Vaccinium darrowii TaxID=229202 RepID=A0ACB7YLX2_9ERIC|nr:hypothetical protein Vadar_010321 [Vaccinium darrowii]
MKKQKVQQVRAIVKEHHDLKSWGQDAQVKVGCCLIQLLMESAYIQPPVEQLGDGPPDIRPAFIHSLKTLTKETQTFSRRYGVIECDPLVRKGLERTARHMVIPYMPMLGPPVNWTGAKQQRDAVKRTPKKQLESVFEALNTLGNTKWRVNKRVIGVIDRIPASGGTLADLVDREDVAQKMKDEDGFFYPHNLDFRGRAYPMHPHLNHLVSHLY